MIKAIGLTFLYAVGVAMVAHHLMPEGSSLGESTDQTRQMMMTMLCLPGAFFFLDYISNKDNKEE